ncbi:MAG TPA: pectin acetylesterase-family hydrolase [Cyclobacteriaceae bacterium]|nr:pectin acetylesterase-family hydrolase [Cyclobacteriaceae bacterium]
MKIINRFWLSVLAFCYVALSFSQTIQSGENQAIAEFKDLNEGWNTLKPGGETMCARGTEYEFHVRPASSEKILVVLFGGGACWDAKSCDTSNRLMVHRLGQGLGIADFDGILNFKHPENPFKDYTIIAVPYCTGDVHFGNRDVVYTKETADGKVEEFTVHHRGKVNTFSAIEWIQKNIKSPKEIFVTGFSAGAIASPFYASYLAQHYRNAQVTSLSDDSGSFNETIAQAGDPSQWGLPNTLNTFPGWEKLRSTSGFDEFVILASKSAENLKLFQVNHAFDHVQASNIKLTSIQDPNVFELIQETDKNIKAEVPHFKSNLIGGNKHTSIQLYSFYGYQSNGIRLRDWVADIALGKEVDNVHCNPCERPELVFTKDDLKALEEIQKLLKKETWGADPPGKCDANSKTIGLRCAIVEVYKGKINNLNLPLTVIELGYTAAQKMNKESTLGSALEYSLLPTTSFEDVMEMLDEVKLKIEVNLNTIE